MSTKPNGRAVWPNFNTVELWFETELADYPLICTLEVEEERDGYPATYTLVGVTLNHLDVMGIISDDLIGQIQEAAYITFENPNG
jgi:hypothetical protein